ncbi:amino acid adenylation domain-containing protein [Pendulispora albinea]|uniref:Amino acid adenylation domain-containing protein n=1 Tax=Pendulispora albinea TaxID=2741071 RepID=A0ABZ2LXU0_9BACT
MTAPSSSPHETLVDVLRFRAEKQPRDIVFRFLDTGDVEQAASEWTYSELDFRARSIAAVLQEHERELGGHPALLLFPPGLDFIAGFLGCLYANVMAVPMYPPDPTRLDRTLPRLRQIARDSGARAVLTTSDLHALAPAVLPQVPELASLPWMAVDAPTDQAARAWRRPAITADTLAFLQYTSGSTGTPKGVMLSHRNLLHNERLIERAFGHNAASSVVGWLPMFHDMGLIGNVLQPLYSGFPCTLMSPLAFLQRPIRWLKAISTYRATTSGGPNFAYDLCARKITDEEAARLDLSSWTLAYDGAEPVRAETLRRFSEKFARSGFRSEAFYPCYGLAEATLFVTGARKGEGARVRSGGERRSLVSSGRSAEGLRVHVVEPETKQLLEPGREGEIWISGDSVARGYWGQPAETEATFGAHLANGEGPFLRTGDLGIVEDGELYVTGRWKDLIIQRGRNLYPQDLELTAEQAHASVRAGCVAAFSVDREDDEQLVIAAEIEPGRASAGGAEEVATAIRAAMAEEYGARVGVVVLLEPRSISKTSSGKIQRRGCKELFLAGRLAVVAQSVAPAPEAPRANSRTELAGESTEERAAHIEAFLRSAIAKRTGIAPENVAREALLSSFGLDSLHIVDLFGELEAAFGVSIPIPRLLQHPTVAHAAAEIALARPHDPTSGSPLTAMAPHEGEIPLSSGQARLWYLERLIPGSPLYNVQFALRMVGSLDVTRLTRSLDALMERHTALRTVIRETSGKPRQVVLPAAPVTLARVDLSAAGDDREQALRSWARDEGRAPFDFAGGPYFRAALATLGPDDHALVVTQHHVITDGWSIGVLLEELGALYRLADPGAQASLLPAPAVPYADYARWQVQRIPLLGAERDFWKKRLAGLPRLDLPTDRPRTHEAAVRGGTVPFRLRAALTDALRELGRRDGATLYAVLLAGFSALLYRYTDQIDFGVGTVTAQRENGHTRRLVGLLANTLVVRCDLSGAPTFRELVRRTGERVREALAHGELPFEEVVAQAGAARAGDGNPLFQVGLVFETFPVGTIEVPKMRWESMFDAPDGAVEGTAKFELSLAVAEGAKGDLWGTFEYRADRFDAVTIERLAGHLEVLLEDAVASPDRRVADLPLLTEPERQQILRTWNDTARARGEALSLHALFEAQAMRTPDAVAVIFEGERITYRELDRRANRLAWQLTSSGVAPDVRVGIFMDRSIEMVVALLGVLKAGGAYVPLDPEQPAERLAFMLEDACAPVVLTQSHVMARLPSQGAAQLVMDAGWGHDRAEVPPPSGATCPEQSAYVIYTSGSTGRPKGVINSHRGIVNRIHWMQDAYHLDAGDRVLQKTPFGFDVSVWEFFWPLSAGACIVMARPGGHADSAYLVRTMAQERITTAHFVPSMLQIFLEEEGVESCVHLKRIISSGEVLTATLAQRCLSRLEVELHNLYGPTEAAVDVSSWACTADDRHVVPIGRPIDNIELYVLDPQDRPVPVGVAGELHIAGVGLARGYVNRPELTAERFVPNPFGREPGARMYRTGDRVRWREGGALEFLGRTDHQVKIRGVRIEAGEIEAVLAQHPGVSEAVVNPFVHSSGDRRLAAYVVAKAEPGPDGAALRAFLRQRLPEIMVPSAFVALARLPLTPNGKVNRKELPAPDLRREVEVALVPPRSDIELRIAAIWRRLLGIEQVGTNDNFFDLGGHSLLMVQVHSELAAAHPGLQLVKLLEHPTIGALASYLNKDADAAPIVQVAKGRAQRQIAAFQRQRRRSGKKGEGSEP